MTRRGQISSWSDGERQQTRAWGPQRGTDSGTAPTGRQDPEARQRDLELIEAIRAGDENAFESFYERYGSLVYAVCLRVLAHTADAEETSIDVFWEIWHKPERYDKQRGSVLSYLLVLARSRAIDRRRSRASHASVQVPGQGEDGEGQREPTVQATTPEPAEAVGLREQQRQVVEALGSLSPAQRQALELSFFEGLSHQQIAQQLDQPLGTVKTRIRQGIIQLRDGLRNLGGG